VDLLLLTKASKMGRKVYVVGVGMIKFERPGKRDWDYPKMGRVAGKKALADAGISYQEVQQALSDMFMAIPLVVKERFMKSA